MSLNLNLFTESGDCLRSYRIERVMLNALVANVGSDSQSCFGNNLTAAT